MRILFVAAEVAPLAKVGGMGDVVGTLPKVLRKMGHDVRILMPYYGTLPDKIAIPQQPIWVGRAMSQEVTVHEIAQPDTNIPLYLLGHAAFAPRQIYGGEGEDWCFTLFANGATEFILKHWQPQIVHCHDWHTGMIPVWLYQTPKIKTVFTIHNLAYQGPWRGYLEEITWCPPWYVSGHNTMAAALVYADQVNTVSPTYARQITTPGYGENLEGILAGIQDKLSGILNGLDVESFNPAQDLALTQPFSPNTLEKRWANKLALQAEVGLDENHEVFVIGIISRLVEQKGLDLILEVLEPFLSFTDAQLVVLGTGDRPYETGLRELSTRFPGRMATCFMYSDTLARRIYGGSDAFLMPSRFEPCGISQMIAMRYGCVPLVRRTGGLADTVSHHDPARKTGTGYCFDSYTPLDLFTCMVRAWEAFRFKAEWRGLQERGMAMDFSWEKSAQEYLKLYKPAKSLSVPKVLLQGLRKALG